MTGPAEPKAPTGAPSTVVGSIRAPREEGTFQPPTTLILIRHGRTALTEAGRISGRDGADPVLSTAGEQDASRAAAVVAGFGHPGALLPDLGIPAVIVTSPLLRSRQTARIVADRLLSPVSEQVDPDWVEAGFGEWEGLTYAQLERTHPDELRRWQGSLEYAPPGGESLLDVIGRVRQARQRTVERHRGSTVVVITHATPVRVVLQEALDAGPSALWRMRVTPGAVTAIRYWPDAAEVVTVNATAHLLG